MPSSTSSSSRISEYAAAGRFGAEAGSEPITVNAEVLATAGLITHADRPVKVLGDGDLEVKVFVAADAFTKSARSKIEDAGGFVQLLAPERQLRMRVNQLWGWLYQVNNLLAFEGTVAFDGLTPRIPTRGDQVDGGAHGQRDVTRGAFNG